MRLYHSFVKEMKVSFRSFYIYIEFVMALIIILVMIFVLPEDFTPDLKAALYIDDFVESQLDPADLEELQDESVIRVDDKSLISGHVAEDRNTFGVAIYYENEKVVYDITLQGYESDRYKNLVTKAVQFGMAEDLELYEPKSQILKLEENPGELSDRMNMLPIFIAINSSLMGLFIIAAYIFIDKDEGTIQAFAVTPARVWEYLMSKVGILLATCLVTTMITTIVVAGMKVNYPSLILLLITTNFFGTALGLYISSFYDTLMKAMGALYVVIMILAAAVVAYVVPGFSPLIVRLLPTYPMLYAFREVFLERPDYLYIVMVSGLFLVLGAIFFAMANVRFKKTITG